MSNYTNIIMIIKYKEQIELTCQRLKKARENLGLSVKQLSEELGSYSKREVLKIEKAKYEPTLQYLYDFCKYINIKIVNIIEPYTKKK